jgi:dienelactone hydrolase
MKKITVIVLLITLLIKSLAQDSKYDLLLKTLGNFPEPPELGIDTLEKVRLENGIRYKIKYLVEKSDTLFDEPEDRIKAYLFVPNHKDTEKLPAIIAIHQDANNTHLGKLEPAGLDTSDSYPDQKYGLELFNRGYIVICPDRFGHAERRRIPSTDTININRERDGELYTHRVGQLLLKGRNSVGKEVYDLMRAVDVLCSLDCVDTSKIGAIGHSAGGYKLVYFMFADKRIKVGVSSCGFFELINSFNENEYYKSWATKAIPGLALIGKSSDYLANIAPRPILLTRGKYEFMDKKEAKHMLKKLKK